MVVDAGQEKIGIWGAGAWGREREIIHACMSSGNLSLACICMHTTNIWVYCHTYRQLGVHLQLLLPVP